MKIKYLKNKQIDKIRWDKCIDEAHNGLIYGYSWYLDIVAQNWDALIYEDYSAVLPLTWKKKYNISYIFQPLFTQKFNIFTKLTLTNEFINNFLFAVPKKFKIVDFNFDINFIPDNKSFSYEEKKTYELKLNIQFGELYNNFTKSHKKNIRKALKNNITIIRSDNVENPVLMMKNVHKTRGINIVKDIDYLNFSRITNYALNNNTGKIYDACCSGKLCASAFFCS